MAAAVTDGCTTALLMAERLLRAVNDVVRVRVKSPAESVFNGNQRESETAR